MLQDQAIRLVQQLTVELGTLSITLTPSISLEDLEIDPDEHLLSCDLNFDSWPTLTEYGNHFPISSLQWDNDSFEERFDALFGKTPLESVSFTPDELLPEKFPALKMRVLTTLSQHLHRTEQTFRVCL